MTMTCVHLIFIIKNFIYDNNHGGWALLSEPDNCVNLNSLNDEEWKCECTCRRDLYCEKLFYCY